ncbi:MAG: 4-hydroxy-3-methylbut-2-enyl diphosphate reductase, partial [Defluviitaleaceae bacterium]|nr:4-hydroxy-3-methylbut-2-enyl diphosphate reductase [Defluviitaleaceae bacterium]
MAMAEIILADVYGFCMGVRRAVDEVYQAAEKGSVVVLGAITHNKRVLSEMKDAGIEIARNFDDIPKDTDKTVVIRAHGVSPDMYEKLQNSGMQYIDLTCLSVAANQKLARRKHSEGWQVIITGDGKHPEIEGVNGWADNAAIVLQNADDVLAHKWDDEKKYFLMSQTTFCSDSFNKIHEELKKIVKNLEVSNTICRATTDRQKAAKRLAAGVDKMVVLGDKTSSNSVKLYNICKEVQKNTYLIEDIEDLRLLNFKSCGKIGITAGASTPPNAIKEAIEHMSEQIKKLKSTEAEGQTTENLENFEDMLNESVTSLHTGQIVTGKVISIVNGEVMVDLQYKSDGVIQRGHFSEVAGVDPKDHVAPGDEITVFVLRVNDGDGNVLLSKKRVDAQKGYKDIEAAFTSGEPLPGKVMEVIKGGISVNIS